MLLIFSLYIISTNNTREQNCNLYILYIYIFIKRMKIQSLERTVESKESRESFVFLSFRERLIELSPVST